VCVLDAAAAALLVLVARDIGARSKLRSKWAKMVMVCLGCNVGLGAVAALVVHDRVSDQIILLSAVVVLIALHLGVRSAHPRSW
jgi:hypothetical protein